MLEFQRPETGIRPPSIYRFLLFPALRWSAHLPPRPPLLLLVQVADVPADSVHLYDRGRSFFFSFPLPIVSPCISISFGGAKLTSRRSLSRLGIKTSRRRERRDLDEIINLAELRGESVRRLESLPKTFASLRRSSSDRRSRIATESRKGTSHADRKLETDSALAFDYYPRQSYGLASSNDCRRFIRDVPRK